MPVYKSLYLCSTLNGEFTVTVQDNLLLRHITLSQCRGPIFIAHIKSEIMDSYHQQPTGDCGLLLVCSLIVAENTDLASYFAW